MHPSISLEARLLQVRDGMSCEHDKIPDNAILPLTAFASKTYQVLKRYSKLEGEVLEILHGLENMSSLLLCHRGKSDHKSEATSNNP